MKKQYVVGIDFGTLSGRAVLVDPADGRELAEETVLYPHGVMDCNLPDGTPLPPLFALQHPQDYTDVLGAVRRILDRAGVDPADVAGMGIDFTTCTMLPVDRNGTPLCLLPEFAGEPHAYVKLWKHHAAQPEADEITALAQQRGEEWLACYGGKISSEWMFPKILETLRKAPRVYEATDRFTEAADWLSRILTGVETHSAAFAGYKAIWNAETGYPSDDFLSALDRRLHGIVGTKLSKKVLGVDQIAGTLDERGNELTGLPVGTPLALPMPDAHVAMPALNVVDAGDMMLIVGTSGCHLLHGNEKKTVDGICGYVLNGVIPGLYTYEAGQAAVGDIFDWFVKHHVPEEYCREAAGRGISVHQLLREKAEQRKPGESGLIALDWVNGNRSVLVNANLSGMMIGMTMRTRPEDEYRAWIEATAYGTRMIVDQLERFGINIRSICAAGGIAKKDAMMMQIYADVTGKEIRVAASSQAGALGSAIYAAVAAGIYPDLRAASRAMSAPPIRTYRPIAENQKIYEKLYTEYKTLHDYFGRGENNVMSRLNQIRFGS